LDDSWASETNTPAALCPEKDGKASIKRAQRSEAELKYYGEYKTFAKQMG
jgi:hypothetical protein